MKIGITGVTGLIGKRIAEMAVQRGHQVIGFSRKTGHNLPHCIETRLFSLDQPINLDGIEVVIHLAGESIIGFWSAAKKERILQSRRDTTRALVQSIGKMQQKPAAFLCASGTGYYGNRGDQLLDENAAAGTGFLAEVCEIWESEATAAAQHGVRVCLLRTSMILSAEGGAFPLLRRIFNLGLGGKLGSGQQYMPWLHLDDIAALFLFCAENSGIEGAINASAPDPVTNAGFTRAMAAALHRPAFLPAPAFALKILLREQSSLFLDSQRVVPAKAVAHGYTFAYPTLPEALTNLLNKGLQNG